MSYELIIKIEALAEINEAYDWYEEQSVDLGSDFVAEIEACYKKLIDNPAHFPFHYNQYRRIKTNRFPYLLIYEIMGNEVVVLRVRHNKQQPL